MYLAAEFPSQQGEVSGSGKAEQQLPTVGRRLSSEQTRLE